MSEDRPPGPVLALETSTRRLGIALGRPGHEPVERDLDPERPHASDLAPLAAECLAEAGLAPGDLVGLAVGIGPGSFTGLRVAAALALGLERAVQVPLVAVPSFEALLADARGGTPFEALVLGDARAHRLYTAHYAVDERLAVRAAPEAPSLERFADWLAAREFRAPLRVWADGSALERDCDGRTVREVLAAACGELPPPLPIAPTARGVLALGTERLARGERTPAGVLRPLYLSRFGQRD